MIDSASPEPVRKRRRLASNDVDGEGEYGDQWRDWPAPAAQITMARSFILDAIARKESILIVPDKDADGLSAGTMLYKTLLHLGHSPDKINVHHLSKGNNVHSPVEMEAMDATQADRAIVLDQGSRPGPRLLTRAQTLIIDHHQSSEFPQDAKVVTACKSSPIATASLLTYIILRDLHQSVRRDESWRALVGTFGDLGPREAKWGQAPWPSDLGVALKQYGAKHVSDCVAAINAPRRTADYNVPRAWDVLLDASLPQQVANHAYLQLCKLDVRDETEKWARTAPRFSQDGRVALITIDSGFQIHPVIATRWAGNLGRKSKKLIMIMCANKGYNPDPSRVSFSCRLASSVRGLPETQRPDLIAMLRDYADSVPGLTQAVGADFARGHKEATGGIIPKHEFARLIEAMGIHPIGSTMRSPPAKSPGRSIKDFFKPV